MAFLLLIKILYIPHGSDESFTSMRYAGEVPHFISHMVQMKGCSKSNTETPFYKLYIPHGSDESLSHAQAVLEAYTFISHMVQMKESFYHADLS